MGGPASNDGCPPKRDTGTHTHREDHLKTGAETEVTGAPSPGTPRIAGNTRGVGQFLPRGFQKALALPTP